MTKFTDLTKEQQGHFTSIINQYEIPEGTTHLDLDDRNIHTFMMNAHGKWYYYHDEMDDWCCWKYGGADGFYPLPSPPYYNPEDVSLKSSASNALDVQEGGNHYKKCKIQPIEYIHANNIGYLEGNVIKYVTRHKDKNGVEDIKKAMHYLELILEMQYGDN